MIVPKTLQRFGLELGRLKTIDLSTTDEDNAWRAKELHDAAHDIKGMFDFSFKLSKKLEQITKQRNKEGLAAHAQQKQRKKTMSAISPTEYRGGNSRGKRAGNTGAPTHDV